MSSIFPRTGAIPHLQARRRHLYTNAAKLVSGRKEAKMARRGREKASRLRQELLQVQEEVGTHLEKILRRRVLLRGSIYEWKRKCGAKNCSCTKGALHSSWVLSYREGCRVRKVTVPAEELRSYRAAVDAHRAFRADRAKVIKGQTKIRELLREIEETLCIEPPTGRSRQWQ